MSVRGTLSRERIVDAAAAVADRDGLASVSMRTVGAELKVQAMSLYHHVSNKEALLNELAEWVFSQIELPEIDAPWREQMVRRAQSARQVLRAHPWGLGMLESRPVPGPALLRHHDRVMGCLMAHGFSAALATHAFSTIDAFVYGFVLTESGLPFAPGEGAEAEFAAEVAPSAEEYPHLARALAELFGAGEYAFENEFGDGLTLILDGLELQLSGTNIR
ncbi:TetR/AcrR family transcriptional regulator C-terminal domain-containing protein [Salinibacterium amurskyense]|uniref:TetR/AcrR family transcriptional regulator C-terminal domain-containing protein n=1 Tax=Salinibacterium amurskyense TaxID=205941 RepID=UPI000C24832B|nr:TetR/AcrR family transcriptional regulator C-terminal domain-containing protein [Salinibacterium amurskyense]RLQ83131.1 TetR family transcriptional regulator [Salinibacterium amurskyense]